MACEIDNASNAIGEVEKDSEGISRVLDVITGIAEQTMEAVQELSNMSVHLADLVAKFKT